LRGAKGGVPLSVDLSPPLLVEDQDRFYRFGENVDE